jgi:hypothetical protein
MATHPEQPWHELPPQVADMLLPLLPGLSDEIIQAVREVPAYARPMDGEFGVGLRAGVEDALAHLVEEIKRAGPAPRPDVYRRLGRAEMRAGRSLDTLLGAYRIGARVAWRQAVAAGESAGLEPATLYALAESIFAYIDVLSGESAEGYALEQTTIAGETELARRRLVRLLVRDPPAEHDLVLASARDAGWELPRSLAVVAMVAAGARDGAVLAPHVRLPHGCIADQIGELTCVIVPDPDAPGRRSELERAVRASGAHGALGTTVGWPDASRSFIRARATLALGSAEDPLISARERSGELLLNSDPVLAAEFAADRLAPLTGLSAGARARMTETLAAWLAEQGRLGAVAERLEIHPQTARYRLGRLRELFGDALDDADQRFWLELALRVNA